MQSCAQAIDIGTRGSLCLAILFWRRIAQGAEDIGIFALPRLEVTNNAKIDQVEVSIGCPHDVGGLKVTEDDWGLARVQVVKGGTELDADIQNLFYGKVPMP